MRPNCHEIESKRACQLLTYALPLVGKAVPGWIAKAAEELYGAPERLEEATMMLCSLCRSMDDAQKASVIYDGRNAYSRHLADWWDAHLRADEERESRESESAQRDAIKATALAKLSMEERAALGLADD